MYLSGGELLSMTISMFIVLLMFILLSFANYSLLKENRFLRERLRRVRKQCRDTHSERPW
jgi:hypothetical protein